jgi:hypothetical protein
MFDIHGRVLRDGWTLGGCDGGRRSPPWWYTIGLADRFGHPELLIVACDTKLSKAILADVAVGIEHGVRLADGDSILTEIGMLPVQRVHQAQLDTGATADWHNYYGAQGRYDLPQHVLQIVADDLCCDNHRRSHWDLSQPSPSLNRSGDDIESTMRRQIDRRAAHKRQRDARRRQQQRRRGR